MNLDLYQRTIASLSRKRDIKSVVLFGSAARGMLASPEEDMLYSDFDFHIICKHNAAEVFTLLCKEIDCESHRITSVRAASGGVKKATSVFHEGQIDFVMVPEWKMRFARLGFRLGLVARVDTLRYALNEMATCLHSGFHFVKGERVWGKFYRDVSRLPGVRMTDRDIVLLADSCICDILWVRKKIKEGELVAARHVLHAKVMDANLRILREGQLRRDVTLLSFGLGRKVEKIGEDWELACVVLGPDDSSSELQRSVQLASEGLLRLMKEVVPDWKNGVLMRQLTQ